MSRPTHAEFERKQLEAIAKVSVEFRKPVEPAEVLAALREAPGRIEAEQASDLAA